MHDMHETHYMEDKANKMETKYKLTLTGKNMKGNSMLDLEMYQA